MARFAPDTKTGKMLAARKQKSRAYAERNELIAWIARSYESHVMPVGSVLGTLNTRYVVCIHSPAGLLCWVISAEENDEYFKPMKHIHENHWDKSTRKVRSERIASLTALPPVDPAAEPARPKRQPKRRPGDFSRPRRAINR